MTSKRRRRKRLTEKQMYVKVKVPFLGLGTGGGGQAMRMHRAIINKCEPLSEGRDGRENIAKCTTKADASAFAVHSSPSWPISRSHATGDDGQSQRRRRQGCGERYHGKIWPNVMARQDEPVR